MRESKHGISPPVLQPLPASNTQSSPVAPPATDEGCLSNAMQEVKYSNPVPTPFAPPCQKGQLHPPRGACLFKPCGTLFCLT